MEKKYKCLKCGGIVKHEDIDFNYSKKIIHTTDVVGINYPNIHKKCGGEVEILDNSNRGDVEKGSLSESILELQGILGDGAKIVDKIIEIKTKVMKEMLSEKGINEEMKMEEMERILLKEGIGIKAIENRQHEEFKKEIKRLTE